MEPFLDKDRARAHTGVQHLLPKMRARDAKLMPDWPPY